MNCKAEKNADCRGKVLPPLRLVDALPANFCRATRVKLQKNILSVANVYGTAFA
jgi:hypothetical protein